MIASQAEQQAMRRMAAERKLVSVMFADIVGSSAMVAGRDPEDADRALRAVLAVLTNAVERYDGTVGQVLGDGVLAIFGAPNAQEEHALRACLAAQDILTAARDVPSGFAVRIGIASGEVLAEVIEHHIWSDYRTVGECVHLAAKLQQKAASNSVLLSHGTVELVPAGLTVQPAGQLRLAADKDPFPVFALASVRAERRTAADLMIAATGPFVGRQREREALFAAYEAARDGFGTALVVSGEAGIGKSRLVGEALRALPDDGRALLQWPQAPIRRLGEPEDLEQVAASLSPLAGGHGPLCTATERAAGSLARAALCDLLAQPVEDPVWDGLQPAERLSAAIDALAAAVVAQAQERTLIILVEDAHWAGPVMRRLLDTVTRALTGAARILLIATTRPESGVAWAPEADGLAIRLEPLAAPTTHEYLDRWLGPEPALAGIKEMLTTRSQGVPLYLEESLRALETAGAIVGLPGRFQPGSGGHQINLPASVHGLLAARIDSLGDEPRRTLLTAAVIGPAFDVGLLQRLAGLSETQLNRHLAELEGAAFIRRSRVIPNLEYSFRHGLIQEVAYVTSTRSDRRALHALIVEALCERRDHDLPGRVELLSHHAFHAENWPAAYMFGRRAGLRAVKRSRLVDATQHFTSAQTALEHLEPTHRNALRRIDLSVALAQVLLPRGLKGVDDQLERARDLALQVGDPVRFARAASIQAAFEWTHSDVDRAIHLCREGLAAIDGRSNLDTRIPLLVRLGGILAEKGLFTEACTILNEASALIPPEAPTSHYGLTVAGLVVANSQLTRSYAELGEVDAAIRSGEEAVDVAEQSGHLFTKVYANGHFGWALLLLGETERSLPYLETALSLCELTRSQLHHPFMMGALGYAKVLCGAQMEGLSLMERSMGMYRHDAPKLWSLQVAIWNAEALLHVGQAERAVPAAQHALRLSQDARRLGYEARARAVYAQTIGRTRRRDAEAMRMLTDAATMARRLSMRLLTANCEQALGRLLDRETIAAQ